MQEITYAAKHAYLIIANDHFDLLCQLLKMLDDFRNDIFLLIDRKGQPVNPSVFYDCVQKGTLYIYPDPIAVYWGDYSQIEAELLLLEYSTKKYAYAYYHLLSGKCIPIKSQNYIHTFFQENAGKEFVSIDNVDIDKISFRYKYDHSYLKKIRAPKSYSGKAITYASVLLQRLLGVDRTRETTLEFKKGANWFSITHRLAQYVVSQRPWIESTFRNTYCCDEIFLQTLLFHSEFLDHVYRNPHGRENNMRYVDWKRGNPYTFQAADAEVIKRSKQLFSRKFDDCETARVIHELCIGEEDSLR